jgi:hypothetical protein
MAKLIGPLFSFSARGTLADTITYSGWKGIEFARQRVIPANPQTASQSLTRDVFRWLNDYWRFSGSAAKAAWDAAAVGQPFTGRNRLLSANITNLRPETDLNLFLGSIGTLNAPAPLAMVGSYAAGPNEATATLTPPSLPVGWTVASGVAVAFPDSDPHDAIVLPVREATDAVSANDVVIPNVETPTGTWQIVAWYTLTRPDGRTAYTPSLIDTITVT